jgi:hypothetical protein
MALTEFAPFLFEKEENTSAIEQALLSLLLSVDFNMCNVCY